MIRIELRQALPANLPLTLARRQLKASLLKPEARFPIPRRGSLGPGKEKTVMTYLNVSPALMRPTHHLDVAPMILALQFQPTDFEYKHGQLRHVPSRHEFLFDRSGRVTIDALCGCAGRSISSEQGDQLFNAFKAWKEFYWHPLEIDREFASHFRAPNAWVRLFRDIRMAWLRFMRRAGPVSLPAEAMTVVPAE
jgi:hypothetical protein